MILTELTQFRAKRFRKDQGSGIRYFNGVKINITQKRVVISCDLCQSEFIGLLHNFYDADLHMCKSCRIHGDRNPRGNKGTTPWNKGLTKETCKIIERQSKKHSKFMSGANHPRYGLTGAKNPMFGVSINKGSENGRYIDGKGRERQRGRRTLAYDRWAKAIKERDGFTCQFCKKNGGVLTSHHICSFAQHPTLRYELNNGICLCDSCHNDFHLWNGGFDKKCTKLELDLWSASRYAT